MGDLAVKRWVSSAGDGKNDISNTREDPDYRWGGLTGRQRLKTLLQPLVGMRLAGQRRGWATPTSDAEPDALEVVKGLCLIELVPTEVTL